jgi:hypothetical protein
LEAVLVDPTGRKRPCWLAALAADRVLWRPSVTGPTYDWAAADGKVDRVVSKDGKLTWTYDPARAAFTGPPLRPAFLDEPLTAAGAADGPADEPLYLYYALLRLHERVLAVVDDDRRAGALRDDPVLKDLRGRAAAVAAQAGGSPGPLADVGRLYRDVPGLIDALVGCVEEQVAILRQADTTLKELERQRLASQSQTQALGLLGFLGMMMSVGSEEWEGSDGRRYYRSTVDGDMLMDGLGTVWQANLNHARALQRLDQARGRLRQEVLRRLEGNQNTRATALEAARGRARAAGARLLGRPEAALAEEQAAQEKALRQSKDDFQGLVTHLEAQAGREPGNPFARLRLFTARALEPTADRTGKGAVLFVLARQAAALTQLIPPGAVFDTDRADVLGQAAALALIAADLEIGDGSWAGAYSARAAYAVRLLDAALALGAADATGVLREQRAWALFRAGCPDHAFRQAQELRDARRDAPTFHYNLAKLYCARRDPAAALKALEVAVKAGFSGLSAARKCADLLPIRTTKQFVELTRVRHEWKVKPGAALDVTNRGLFPWTNVKVHVAAVYPLGNQVNRQEFTTKAARIEPGETYTWQKVLLPAMLANPRVRYTVKVECDQGSSDAK